MFRFLRAFALVCFAAVLIRAQMITASLDGSITDPTGAVLVGAKVRITNTDSGVSVSLLSDSTGRFLAPSLAPGPYQLTVEAAGFKKLERSGIVLQVNQQARLDLVMELGTATETVEVVAQASLLESTNSAMGQVIDNQGIVNLPLNARTPFALVFLVPGTVGSVGIGFNNTNISINGGRPGSNEILADGIPSSPPLVNPIQGYSVLPSIDAVQEFKVQSNSYSAEFGRSGGGIINLVFKSGANTVHGSVFEFLQNSATNANDFFANSRGIPLASFKRDQFGASFGGPVYIPHLYNGHNKTFFYGTYEGLRQGQLANSITTVPTALERTGNFSQDKNSAGQQIVIYDPVTTAASGTGFVRQPFPVNIIPTSRLDPVGSKVAQYYPLPNSPGNPNSGTNNYAASGDAITNVNQFDIKVDENVNDKDRFFVRVSHRVLAPTPADYFPTSDQVARGGSIQPQHFFNAAFDDTWNLSPTFLTELRFGAARTAFFYRPVSDGFDPVQLGLPSYIDANAERLMFPGFAAAGYVSLGQTGQGDFSNAGFESYVLSTNNTKVYSKHVLKFGYEMRLLRVNTLQTYEPVGSFSFNQALTQGPNPNAASSTGGDSMASLLLGVGSSGTVTSQFKNVATTSKFYAFYFADDYKVSRKLTFNLGLRYELQVPLTERYNRANVFDPYVASPLAGPSGIPGLLGGLEFVGVDGRSREQFSAPLTNWAPRFGFAYDLTGKTVLRGGFGIFYAPSLRAAEGTLSNVGYRTDTSYVGSVNGLTPTNYLSNPFPNGFVKETGSSLGLLTGIGSPVSVELIGDNRTPYSENWSFNLQRQITGNIMVEAAYVGSRGVQLNECSADDCNMNQLTASQLALGSQLQQSVANPFVGLITTGPLAAATIPYSFLLRSFPQFVNVTGEYFGGSASTYHSLQMKVEKRFSSGLSVLASFTAAKLIDDHAIIVNEGRDASMQDYHDRHAERGVSPQDVSRILVLSYIYQLPIGRGRYFGQGWSRAVDTLLGQWQINGITTLQTGMPLTLSTLDTSDSGGIVLRPNNDGKSALLSGPVQKRLSEYFNTSVFSQPAPFTFGNTGRTLPNVRGPGINNFDFSLFKDFRPVEKVALQLRAEAFNIFNRVQFNFPNSVLSSGQFGVISSAANSPRQLQLALKIVF